jgi:hypothetical protein
MVLGLALLSLSSKRTTPGRVGMSKRSWNAGYVLEEHGVLWRVRG